uniref:Uncharacterized protein n=1 Tax=Plectus sambesii TaxID=2011161 RepID=A0A914UNK2_9BILA
MTVKQRRRGRSSNEHDEDEVLDLIDSCRRYQEEKALEHHGSHSPLLRKSSSDEELLHLLDRPVILPSPVVSGDENSSESESENRRDSSHLSSMLADSIGSSLRTFVGTAVPTETKEAILRRASEDQLAVRQRAEGGRSHHSRSSLITNTLESTIDTVVPTALQRVPETSHESEPKSNSDSPPVSARGSSVLNRLSYSIKRKMQRMTNPANDASPPPSPRSFRTSIDDRAADLPPPATPTRARQSSSASAQQVQTQLSQPEQESDTADSGVLIRGSSRKRSGRSDASNIQPMRQATSDLESSKYSSKHSSMSSKHGSGKSKSKTAPSDVTPEESRKELSDESFHRLLHSQGLELTDLTESTLV